VALFHCFIKTANLVHVRLSMSSLVQISVSVSTRRIMGLGKDFSLKLVLPVHVPIEIRKPICAFALHS